MDKEITHQDIVRSHPLGNGKPDKNKPRPITIKFSRYVRVKIFKNKIKSKGKRIIVMESLIKIRMERLQKAIEDTVFGISGLITGKF